MNKARIRMSRDQRKNYIYARVAEACQNASRGPSASEIAALVGLARTPYLLDLLEQLVYEGALDWRLDVLPGGWVAKTYFPAA